MAENPKTNGSGSNTPTRTPGDEKPSGKKIPEVSTRSRRNAVSMHEITGQKAGWHYRWVRDDALGITNARVKGYVDVKSDDQEDAKPLVPFDSRADGRIAIGDTVLMRCPESEFQEHQAQLFQQTEGLLSAVDDDIKGVARDRGVKLINTEPR